MLLGTFYFFQRFPFPLNLIVPILCPRKSSKISWFSYCSCLIKGRSVRCVPKESGRIFFVLIINHTMTIRIHIQTQSWGLFNMDKLWNSQWSHVHLRPEWVFSDFPAWPPEHVEGNLFLDNCVQPSPSWEKQCTYLSVNQWSISIPSPSWPHSLV